MTDRVSQTSTRIRIAIFIIGVILLGAICLVTTLQLECKIPFGACYHSWAERPLAIVLFFYGLVLIFSLTILRESALRYAKEISVLATLVTGTVFLAYFIYHRAYSGERYVTAWMDPVQVVPFHVQFAIICFSSLCMINFMLFILLPANRWIKFLNMTLPFIGLSFTSDAI